MFRTQVKVKQLKTTQTMASWPSLSSAMEQVIDNDDNDDGDRDDDDDDDNDADDDSLTIYFNISLFPQRKE